MSAEYLTITRVLQKKPSESAVKQQKLLAWQPIFTTETVLLTFFVIGIAFIPIGVGSVKELVVDYTDCVSTISPYKPCAEMIGNFRNNTKLCTCNISFSLHSDFTGPVYIYYGLTNFHQNDDPNYVKSRDDVQLLGIMRSPSSDCHPYAVFTDKSGNKKPIVPCGAIANSMFDDEYHIQYSNSNVILNVPLLRTGIALLSDKQKFRNPNGDLRMAFKDFAKPVDWRRNIWELDVENPDNNGLQNEDFIVWMRTDALPNFRKLFRRVDHSTAPFQSGLPSHGFYNLLIDYRYPVKGFNGTKSFIISTNSVLGTK